MLFIQKIFECPIVYQALLGVEDTRQTWYMSYTHMLL